MSAILFVDKIYQKCLKYYDKKKQQHFTVCESAKLCLEVGNELWVVEVWGGYYARNIENSCFNR